jgi:hypothetical protein
MFLRNSGLSPNYRALQRRKLYTLKKIVHDIVKLQARGERRCIGTGNKMTRNVILKTGQNRWLIF